LVLPPLTPFAYTYPTVSWAPLIAQLAAERTVTVELAEMIEDGWRDRSLWVADEHYDGPLRVDQGRNLPFTRIVATTR
jgi:hypothetical protein